MSSLSLPRGSIVPRRSKLLNAGDTASAVLFLFSLFINDPIVSDCMLFATLSIRLVKLRSTLRIESAPDGDDPCLLMFESAWTGGACIVKCRIDGDYDRYSGCRLILRYFIGMSRFARDWVPSTLIKLVM